jgi:hypothetical protein
MQHAVLKIRIDQVHRHPPVMKHIIIRPLNDSRLNGFFEIFQWSILDFIKLMETTGGKNKRQQDEPIAEFPPRFGVVHE